MNPEVTPMAGDRLRPHGITQSLQRRPDTGNDLPRYKFAAVFLLPCKSLA